MRRASFPSWQLVADLFTLETSIAAIDALKAAVSGATRRDFRGKSGAQIAGEDESHSRSPSSRD